MWWSTLYMREWRKEDLPSKRITREMQTVAINLDTSKEEQNSLLLSRYHMVDLSICLH